MVRRSVPITRRLRAARGKILLAAIWGSAALFCLALLFVSPPTTPRKAVAVSRTFSMTAPYSGRIAKVLVSPNQTVEAGTILAEIEEPGLTQQIAAAESELKALEAQLAAEEADRGRKFARDLEEARARWLEARVGLEQDRAELNGLDQELARMQSPGVEIPTIQIEQAKARRDTAAAAVKAREAEVASLNRSYEDSRVRAGMLDTALLKTAVEAATVNLEALRLRRDASVLRAHVGGVVSTPVAASARDGRTQALYEVFPATGQWVQAGVPLLSLTETTAQDAVVYVDSTSAQRLAPGQQIAIRASGGESYQATVRAVGVAVEQVPIRQLQDVAVPEWGVPVTLQVVDRVLMPGEALAVDF